jgi:hypothetical protein
MPTNRLFVPLLGAAAMVYAWGPHIMASEPAQDTGRDSTTQASTTQGESLSPALAVAVGGRNDVKLALHVINNGKRRIEVRFPDARTHDFVVMDSTGREVWRWSEGRLFTQALQNRVVDSRETLTFDASWRPAHVGRYTAVAVLSSTNHPLRARADFRIR